MKLQLRLNIEGPKGWDQDVTRHLAYLMEPLGMEPSILWTDQSGSQFPVFEVLTPLRRRTHRRVVEALMVAFTMASMDRGQALLWEPCFAD